MRKFKIKRPSPALVIAILALFLATSGSAYAASKITTSQIKKGAITQSKIAKKAVSTSKLKTEAVGTAKLKDESVTTDKLGDQSVTTGKLADSAVSAKQFGSIVARDTTTTVAAASNGTATALCQADEKVIGGGFETPVNATNVWITQESVRDTAQNGWRVGGRNFTAANVQLKVTVYCLAA
jgi:hypothetical protein